MTSLNPIKITKYKCPNCDNSSTTEKDIKDCIEKHLVIESIKKCTRFTITDNHMKLLQKQRLRFQKDWEYGSTEVSPKRPYGNGNVVSDIFEIIGVEPEDEEDWGKVFSIEQCNFAYKIHVETYMALSICMQRLKFETGTYIRKSWILGKWVKEDNE